ncbi:MAG: biosynthetic-type acetolactate synthase large subunit [Acidobacteria bacterium]|nr:biosynthetic-type acetolactate synthase large subunit [Acidobacteriota bacterium]
MKRTGAQIVWECLVREGVDTVFGYPGGAILPIYDAMLEYPVRHVLVRHEQGAAHMADGYARASGRVGVALATSGPGATNLVTGIATAMLDSIPVVFITGQVPSKALGTDAFQEADITGITLPITKHNALVTRVEDLAAALTEAFRIARSGRPGPVLVDICKDVQQASTELVWPEPKRARRPVRAPLAAQIEEACALIANAERPLILAGHGVIESGSTALLTALAEKTETPVALTLLGLGGFPRSHPLCLGMMGMHGEAYVNKAIQEADLLIALGMRFDDRVTGKLETYARKAKKIHVELDASEIGKNVPVDVGICADLRATLEALLPVVAEASHPEWMADIAKGKGDTASRDIVHRPSDGRLLAAHVIHDVWRATGGGAVIVTDVGQHQMFEAQYHPHEKPRSLLTSGGLGTMGFALPAAIGAKIACPDAEVWVIAGDGGFQMTLCELATLMQEKVDVKIAIVDNGFLGMVRQWQEFFYDKRYAATPLLSPDFVALAAAYGLPAHRVTTREGVIPTVNAVRAAKGPALVHFVVEAEEAVYPMVPAGQDLHAMIRRPHETALAVSA